MRITPEPTPVAGTEKGDTPRVDISLAVIVTTDLLAFATTSAMSPGFARVPVTTAFGVAAVVGWEPPRATDSSAVVDADASTADRRQAARTVRMPARPRGRRPVAGELEVGDVVNLKRAGRQDYLSVDHAGFRRIVAKRPADQHGQRLVLRNRHEVHAVAVVQRLVGDAGR